MITIVTFGIEQTARLLREKRILITKWCGNAYRHLNTPKYDSFWWRLFEKTALITEDSSNNN